MINISEISIGDGVYFNSTQSQSNYGALWTIKSKSVVGELLIEVDVDDILDSAIIRIEDVTELVKKTVE